MRIALLSALAIVAFIASVLSVSKPKDATVLYLPVVAGGSRLDPRKGIAGFSFAPTYTQSQSYAQMGVSAAYNWQTWLTPTWNTTNAYPLPSQPLNEFRSLGNQWPDAWFSMFRLGFVCNTTQAALATCAGDVVRGQGAITVLYGNELDGSDPNYSDALTPTLAAMDWHTVRMTLLAANPSVRFVVGGFLWPNANYANQFVSEYQRLYGESALGPNDKWGFHAYSNFGWLPGAPCNSPAHYPADAQCVSAAFGRVLAGIDAAAGGRAYWITELGISGGFETAQADYAAMLPDMCKQLRASKAEKFFGFIGNHYPSIPNAEMLDADGNMTPVGAAWAAC